MFEPSLGSNAIGGMFQKEGTGKSKLGFFFEEQGGGRDGGREGMRLGLNGRC
jgi:hypothetical protein